MSPENDLEETDVDVTLDPEAESSDADTEGGEKSEDDVQEFQVVLPEADGSQPDQKLINRIVSAKVNKLNRRNDRTVEAASQAEEDNKILRERVKLLQLNVDQLNKPAAPVVPDPNDFDDGVSDPKYIGANNEYLLGQVSTMVEKQPPPPPAPVHDHTLERRQIQHYEAAEKLGAKDYDEVEARAIEALGKTNSLEIIKCSDYSPEIFYHLGQNLDKAEYFNDLIKTNPVKGIMDIGVLGAKLKVLRPKANLNPAPDPDTELSGAAPPRKGERGPQGATYS